MIGIRHYYVGKDLWFHVWGLKLGYIYYISEWSLSPKWKEANINISMLLD